MCSKEAIINNIVDIISGDKFKCDKCGKISDFTGREIRTEYMLGIRMCFECYQEFDLYCKQTYRVGKCLSAEGIRKAKFCRPCYLGTKDEKEKC